MNFQEKILNYKPASRLVGYFFNQKTGTSVNDLSANNYDTDISGCTIFQNKGLDGEAVFSFDGVNDHLPIGATSTGILNDFYTNQDKITISISFRFTADADHQDTVAKALFNINQATTSNNRIGFQHSGLATGAYTCNCVLNAVNYSFGGTGLSDTLWHHYVYSHDFTNDYLTMAMDGNVLKDITNCTDTYTVIPTANRFLIGGFQSSSIFWKGQVGHFFIWKGVYSDAATCQYLSVRPY